SLLGPSNEITPLIQDHFTKRINYKSVITKLRHKPLGSNSFSEMILNKRGDFITGLFHKGAEFSRLSKQNRETLEIEYLYYSTHFGVRTPPNNEWVKIDLVPWWQPEKFIGEKVKRNIRKFAWHSRLETPGIKYYARAPWLGLFRKNGWIDASIAVPEVVNAMMRNQVIITYQISIPESYFEIRYNQDWHSFDTEKRTKIIDQLIDSINSELSGTDNLYKSISTVFRQHEMNGSPMGMIEIKPIGDQIKKDSWVPTSDVADAQVVQGMGLHPSQMGLGTKNGGMGAGSGSDQREGYNTEITTNTMEQVIALEPLNFCMQFNSRVNKDFDVTFVIDHTHHTTTNNQESGLQPSDTTIVVE
ncbi:MAG: hypothetical protein AAFO02_15470, partial [Bacteroidota bacterium]